MQNGLAYRSYVEATGMQGDALFGESVNPELEHKVKKVTEKFSENLHIVANEPSLALFRIQEHVRKSLPVLVEKKQEVQELQEKVQGSSFDTEYAINAVRGMYGSKTHFQNIQDLLKNSMFMKQQLHYEHQRREQMKSNPSMYTRMQRTNTLDIPVTITCPNTTTTATSSAGKPKKQGPGERPRSASLVVKKESSAKK